MESNVNQRNDKLLARKIDDEVKKYGVLKSSFSKISEAELALSKSRSSAFEGISKIEETDNKYLKEIYLLFHGTMTELETLRKNQLSKLNNLIIPATTFYPDKVKAFRTNLDKLGEIKKSKEKQQNEIVRAQTKKEFEKVSKLNSEVKKNEDEEMIEGNKVESGLADFEAERSTDNKYLLLHYIHSELAFHANALEKLTKLYGEIMCHDPKELLPEFVNNYNLNSLKESNLANKYGFNPGETSRKLEKFKNSTLNVGQQILKNTGFNLNAKPNTPNQKSAISRLEEDPIINDNNKPSQSVMMTKSSFSNTNQGFGSTNQGFSNTGNNFKLNMTSSAYK